MTRDQELYEKIGSKILEFSPSEAEIVYVKSDVSEGGDHASLAVVFEKHGGIEIQHSIGGKNASDVIDDIIEIYKFFELNARPVWRSFQMKIETQSGTFEVSFGYQ